MKRVLIFMVMLLLLSNCTSMMMGMMKNKMKNMSAEEKQEMMMQMMGSEGDSSCMTMMEEEMDVMMNDSLSKAEKAVVMLPVCFTNILQTVDEDQKAQYLADMVGKIIKNSYPCLPAQDTTMFKQNIRNIVDEL